MRQKSLITLVSVLALFLGGCPSDEESPTVQSTPTPVAPRVSRKPTPEATPFAAKPLTATQPVKTGTGALIQSLPPDARVNQIRKNLGRNDPFAAIPTVPIVIPPSPTAAGPTGNRPVPVIPQLPPPRGNTGTGGNQRGTSRTNPGTSRANPGTSRTNPGTSRTNPGTSRTKPTIARGTTGTSRPNVLPPVRRTTRPAIKPPTTPLSPPGIGTLPPLAVGPRELPQLPEPTLARTIEVTGVVEAGGVQSAIVKVPNEPARSVREGERLSNGQVLVKRIEVNRGPTPIVILEQFGQEVARQVGEGPSGAPAEQPASPTAFWENPRQKNPNTPQKA